MDGTDNLQCGGGYRAPDLPYELAEMPAGPAQGAPCPGFEYSGTDLVHALTCCERCHRYARTHAEENRRG